MLRVPAIILALLLSLGFTALTSGTSHAEDPGGGLITGECGSDETGGINQPNTSQIAQGIIACTEEGIALRASHFAQYEPELLPVLALFTSYENRKDNYESCAQHLADLVTGGDADALFARGLPSVQHDAPVNFDFPGHPEGIFLYCNASGLHAALPTPGDCSRWWQAGGIQRDPSDACVEGAVEAWQQWAAHPVPATTLDTGSVKCSLVYGCYSTAAPDRDLTIVQLEELPVLRPPSAGSGGLLGGSLEDTWAVIVLLAVVPLLAGGVSAAALLGLYKMR